jgi:hypothetical protein
MYATVLLRASRDLLVGMGMALLREMGVGPEGYPGGAGC